MNENLPAGFIEESCEEYEAATNWYISKFGEEPQSPQKALDEYITYFETQSEE